MLGIGGFNPISLLASAAFGPAGGILAQLATQVISQFGEQLLQQLGNQIGANQSEIELAQAEFTGRLGDLPGTARNLDEALDAFTQEAGASPAEAGDLQRQVQDAFRNAMIEASQSEEVKEARSGGGKKGGSWLLAMARALGAAADRKADKLEAMSAGLDKAKPSETAEFQAETQEFNLLMSAMTSTIKGIGEAMANMAKRN